MLFAHLVNCVKQANAPKLELPQIIVVGLIRYHNQFLLIFPNVFMLVYLRQRLSFLLEGTPCLAI